MNTQFLKEPVHVGVNGGRSNSKPRSDFLVLHPFKEAGQDLLLPRGEVMALGNLPDLLKNLNQKGDDLLRECELTFEDIIDGTEELLRSDRFDQKTLRPFH